MSVKSAARADVTRQVLFIQGGGKDVHDRWDDKLVHSLRRELGAAYELRYPRMPNETDARYMAWKRPIESELDALQPGAVVVGHSLGGMFLVNAVVERPPACALGAICLIATPFIGNGGWTSDEIEPRTDLGARLPQGVPIFLYHGRDDEIVPAAHVELYAKAIPHARVRRLPGRDHQLHNDLSEVADDIRGLDEAGGPSRLRP